MAAKHQHRDKFEFTLESREVVLGLQRLSTTPRRHPAADKTEASYGNKYLSRLYSM